LAEYAPTVDRVPGQTFLVLAFDGEDSAETREQALNGHLEYVEKNCNRYLVAGPLREPGDTTIVGSFFLLVADDEADARRFLSGDPYMQGEMYADVRIMSATPAAGRWMGGVIWDSADSIRGKAS